jgi:hypothetical protein
MIRNEEELTQARQRLELIRDELAILRYDVLPENRRTHDLMCEYFVKRIDDVQGEIDAFVTARGERPAESAALDLSPLEAAYGGLGQA